MFFSKLVGPIFFFYSFVVCSSETENTDVIEFCDEIRSNRKLLLVSTLDGQFTAINLEKGEKKWAVATEPGPLLSSTIHHLELSENSQLVRIIPSLSGGLYKFDGESIEPMPVNTDSLLKSSSNNVDISGGKEIRSYAIDIENGTVLYECSMNECSNWTENTFLYNDMMILRRETQKVRAIELPSRVERWNYSVGLHNVTITHNGGPECISSTEKSKEFSVRAVVPKGLLFVSDRSNPEEKLWEYEFDSPIVNVWTLIGSRLKWIDLFKPAENSSKKDKPIQPTLYIGIHDHQLYIQENEPLHNNYLLGKTRFYMKKFHLIHALDFENKLGVVPQITDKTERNSSTALAILNGSDLAKGEGFYLYCPDGKDCQAKKGPLMMLFLSIFVSYSYWKETLVLFSVTCYVIHCIIPIQNWPVLNAIEFFKAMVGSFLYLLLVCGRLARSATVMDEKYTRFWRRRIVPEPLEEGSTGPDFGFSGIVCQTENELEYYRSRYLDDFEPIHCLGKGGFGVVFQARNKIDDCHYAIKRITLPYKEEARERVMREVKALAKLEHQHIVRYFQAWQECPPLGWQEEQDKLWKNKTKDEFLSSEAECQSGNSLPSSNFTFDHRNVPSSETNMASTKHHSDKSDSFIVFESSPSDNPVESSKYDSSSTEKSHLQPSGSTRIRKSTSRVSKVYLYIQMQLCQKNSLREWLCDNLEREQNAVLQMFYEIVQAVEYVHLQGLIHRDLKPSNIFFSLDGQIKVGDFGLVTEIIEDGDLIVEQRKKSAKSGIHTANVGTELYMSPEQLLTPFSTQMERYRALTSLRNNQFPSDFRRKYRKEFELLQLMLSKEPEKRPTTFGIRSRAPFNNLHVSENFASSDWHFELPAKGSNSAYILRKSSNETV